MRIRFGRIAAAVMVLFFINAGVSSAEGWKRRGHYGPPGHAHGYYKHNGPPAHGHAPRYAYQRHYHHYHHHRYPVVVQKHYYQPPAYYVAPAPRGFFFGLSALEPGFAFSFGVSGR